MVVTFFGLGLPRGLKILPLESFGLEGLGVKLCFTFAVAPLTFVKSRLGTFGLETDLVKSSLLLLVPILRLGGKTI